MKTRGEQSAVVMPAAFGGRVLVLAVAIVMGAVPSWTQVLYGTVVGVVEDPSGGVIPGASVTIVSPLTNVKRQTASDANGAYRFADLPPGIYDLSVTQPGFATFRRTGIPVRADAVVRVDVRMQLAGTAETVTVTAAAAALQTDRADVASELGRRELTELPVPGFRNFQSLLKLVPGFSPPAGAHSLAGNPMGALVTNVNGTSYSNNNTRVDGVSATYLWLPHIVAYVPPLEAIESVNVLSGSYDAEHGQVGGAVVSVNIKSGTNEYHGSAFEYHLNSHLRARNFFYPPKERIPKEIVNQFGATLGGPLRKDKLFFFVSYEGLRRRQSSSKYVTVATEEQRLGNFAGLGARIFDPLTGTPDGANRLEFPGSLIPLSRIDRISQKLIALLPKPNLPGTVRNLFVSAPLVFDRNHYDAKVNWNPTARAGIWGRYSQFTYSLEDQHVLGPAGGTGVASDFPGSDDGTVRSATLGATWTVSPSLLIDGHAGYTRQVQLGHDKFYGQNIGLDVLGIPGTNGPDIRQSGFPGFSVSGYEGFGNPITSSPRFRWDNQFQYAANTSWTTGRHDLRWGWELGRQGMNRYQPQSGYGPRGGFSFTGGVTALRGGPAPTQFNSWASFLLGLPSGFGKSLQTLVPGATRQWIHSLYWRDRWQIARRVTFSFGVRWEYYPMPTRDHRGLERYDIESNKVLVGGVGIVPVDTGTRMSKRQVVPRAGLAWRVSERTVLRAGYGMSVDPYSIARPLFEAYPLVITSTYSAANTYVAAGSLERGIPPMPSLDLGDGIIPIPGTVAVTTIEKDFHRGYVQSFNLTIQRELPMGLTGQLAYVGTRSIRQTGLRNLNAAPPGTGAAGQPLNILFGRTASTNLHAPAFTSNYNSLQAKLDRRLGSGWLLTLSYTFSKAIVWGDNSDSSMFFNTPSAFARNRALAGYDRPHNFQSSFVVELPFGRGKRWLNRPGLWATLASGWQVSGVFSAYTGTPFTVTSSGTSLNAPGNSQVADLVKPRVAKLGGVGPGQSYFDPFAFRSVTEPRFGTAGLKILRGPGFMQLDGGLFRELWARERWRVQLRAETFNVSNTPHFGNPGANVSNMILNPDGSIRSLGGYTEITTASGERQFRLALRLSF
jgi:hypothetical protein